MKIIRSIWIPIAVLLLWLALSWMLGSWIGLHKPGLYYLRGGLAIIGIIGFAGYLILRPKQGASQQQGVSRGELEDNFDEAAKRLQDSGVKQIGALPAVFFLGDTDTAKTSVIAKSDIAQLLAGQAQQDVSIVATRAVNFWLAKNTVFVDPAGALLGDASNRKRLFKKFSVMAMKSVMGSRKLPARSVVFTVDCATFLGSGGAEAIAVKARQFQAILAELAQEIGSRFPVYVLFTKADKLSYFRDYVENLTEQEAAEVFGVTLPLETQQGVYSQEQTRRVGEAFQQLYYSLADRRPTYLSREHKPAALPNIYEFPREFNKLRDLLTTFLVDICRPSQLGISPFLRGFYFTGIRAVTVSDVAPAALQVQASEDSGLDAGATRMFTYRERGAPIASELRETGARKMAQWVYLQNFLPGVILADSTADSAVNGNVKLNVARRILLATATAAALVMGTWWTISYIHNRTLIHGALDAAKDAPAAVSYEALERLTRVKDTLDTLNHFEEDGHPLSYGGMLYGGEAAHESVRKAYYGLFRRWLLVPTQDRLVQVCSSPSDAQQQDYFYDALKAYLITTEYHDKSKPEFLPRVLLEHWKKVQPVDGPTEQLARQNFDFYSRELVKNNKYWPPTKAEERAVNTCRDYLNRFKSTDRIYQDMRADAGANLKAIVFNDDYRGTDATVINRYRVEPAFTKEGYGKFEALLKNPDKYINGEHWVLGDNSKGIDKAALVPELRQKYQDEFIRTWRAYLGATKVKRPGGIPDAITKLDLLSSTHSALLLDLCVASENTSVGAKEVSDVFQPVQTVSPPGCFQSPVSSAANPYVSKLLALQLAIKAIEKGKPETYKQAQNAKLEADGTVKTLAFGFKPPTDDMVKAILLAPIWAPDATDSKPNDLAKTMCDDEIFSKYPFNRNSSQDVTFEELNKFLKKPEGMFWSVVNDPAMKPYLTQVNDRFSAASDQLHPARPSFIAFLNKTAALWRVLYTHDGQTAGFSFTMKPVPSEIVDHVSAKINGQNLSIDGKGHGTTEPFPWPGNKEGVQMEVQWVGGSKFNLPERPGLWGLWRFIDIGKEVPGSSTEFKWVQEVGGVPETVGGKTAEIHFTFDPAAAEILRPNSFKLTCVSKVN